MAWRVMGSDLSETDRRYTWRDFFRYLGFGDIETHLNVFLFQSNPYGLKESGQPGDMSAWTSAGLPPTTGYYTYDPTLTAYG